MSLDIWLHGVLTALATPKSGGRKVVIDYSDEACLGYGGGAPMLSCSLPSAACCSWRTPAHYAWTAPTSGILSSSLPVTRR